MKIDGIILTPAACKTLLQFQIDDNGYLKSAIKKLNKINKKIAVEEYTEGGDANNALYEIAFLFSLCEDLENLFAVEQEGGAQ